MERSSARSLPHLHPALGLALLLGGVAAAGCSSGGDGGSGRSCMTSADCPGDEECVDRMCTSPSTSDGGGADTGPGDDGGGADRGRPPSREIESIAIEPATAELLSTDGSMPEQDFEVVATYSDGTSGPPSGPTFAIDTVAMGTLDEASGTFVANGVIGGTATVTAAVTDPATGTEHTAEATVTVRIEREIVADGVGADPAGRFGSLTVDPSRAADIVYPLEGAVMPQNVFPADVQWMRGVEGDLFEVKLVKPHVTVVAYVAHTGAGFQNDWLVARDAWRSVAQTDPDDPVELSVSRWEQASGEAIRGTPVTFRFAKAALTGSVYYWDIEAGRIKRIDDGSGTAVSFMPTPPAARDGVQQCVGCHTVSNDGRWMAGRLGGGENIGAVFDLTTDLTGDPPPTEFPLDRDPAPTSVRWWFSSWSPDDTRMVITTNEGGGAPRPLAFMDPFSGETVAVDGSLPTNATHPAWSPDGELIAYLANIDNWGGATTAGDIATIDVTGPDAVGASRVIHSGSSLSDSPPGGVADCYPSWTPDSERIAFAHGTGCRSDTAIDPLQRSALYIMGRDGGDVVRLDRANGGTDTGDDFQPRFSPFDSGGYYWLSFLSRRDYGNPWAGTEGTSRQQIWVTAIDKDAAPGEDPSEVAYWLPGQDTASRNISAYWAPRPCRPDGAECSVGSECCGGDCRPDDEGTLVCSPPPPERCRAEGETCGSSADCCEGLSCSGRVCIRPPG